jgi:alginate O-acetyltransferase complex protein AlgI
MLFNTPQFFAFLAAVLLLFYAGPRRARKPLLLSASYFFYMCWIPKFILLLLALTTIDYTAALWIDRSTAPRARRTALVVSLGANLGLLAFFKYYNFFGANLAHLLHKPDQAFARSIILPLGISFHTFQSMSYVVDVYRREQRPVRNFLDYALFISFFPQLVAGPIVRAREFFKDLFDWHAPDSAEISHGLMSVLFGLVKKVVIADQFAEAADAYFNNPHMQPGTLNAFTGMLAFGMQIFFDFSGYTDMAIGMAALFGFHFPLNFRRPYLAVSITDFWRRWHMSLSRWLRDYLYIPLGGNRRGALMTYRNLMLTMLLGGLWHGANWNFVVWGGYHGALLSAERALGVKAQDAPAGGHWFANPLRWLVTFLLVLIGWIFFRAATLADSLYVLSQFLNMKGHIALPRWEIWLVLVSAALALAEERTKWFENIAAGPAWVYGATCAALLLFVELFGYAEKAKPFVYFQF